MKRTWRNFIKKAKGRYQQIRPVFCPAFGEFVYFDERGFNHLIMKTGKYRSRNEQKRRMGLVHKSPSILKKSKNYTKYYETSRENSKAYFWSFTHLEACKIIIVVVRQINAGQKHFLSIMDKKLPKSAQTP